MTANSNKVSGVGVRVVSWNVRGLNHPIKRNKVFLHLNKLKGDIVYFQETHLLKQDQNRIKRAGFTKIYHSSFNCKARGVAILSHRSIQFKELNTIQDKDGRYVIVQGTLGNTPVILANIYAPNWDNRQFFQNIFSLLPDLDRYNLILGGDFSYVLRPTLDRSHPSHNTGTSLNNSAQCINAFLQTYGMAGPWRFKHPTSKQFSFFSHHINRIPELITSYWTIYFSPS